MSRCLPPTTSTRMNFPQYAWFDANATRESAAARLQNEAVGTFLVRRGSQFNQLALSVRRPEGVIHYAMSQSNGEWRWSNGCEPYPSAPGAPTMPALLFGLPDGFINIAKPSQKIAQLRSNMQIPVGAPPSRTGTLNRTSAHMRLPTVETAANPTPIRNGLPPPQPSQQGHANVVALHAAAMVAAAPQLIPPPIAGNADGRPRSPNNAAAQQLPPILSLHRVGNNSTPPPPGAGGNRSTPPPTAAATTTTTTRGFRRATATIATLLEPTPAQPERAATIAVLSPLPSDPLAAAAVVVTSRNVCSFVAGGHGLVRQRVFRCEQCQVECCASCAATCHAGHSAAFTKSAAFYCPCGATTSCKALSTESAKVLAAARDNVCTVTRTGREYVKQVYYRCLTCNLVGNLGCCAVCVSVCHAGHQLELPAANLENSGTFFCDCGIGAGTGKCRALTSNRVDENPDQYLQFALGDDPRSLVLFSNVDGRLDLEAYVKLFFKERPSTVRPAKFVLIDGTSHAWPLDTDVSALPKTVKARTLKIYGVPDEDELDLDL